jgi:hypothetical protein
MRQSPVTVRVTIPQFEESIMIGSPSSGRVTSQSAQSEDRGLLGRPVLLVLLVSCVLAVAALIVPYSGA